MQFADIEGNFKNVAITSSQLKGAGQRLYVWLLRLSRGMLPTDNADMFLYPDLDTFTIFPWGPPAGKSGALYLRCIPRRPHSFE